MSDRDKLRLFAEFLRLQFSAYSILFQLLTGIKPPGLRDLMRIE